MVYRVEESLMQRELEFLNSQIECGAIYGYSYSKEENAVTFYVTPANC